MFDDADLDSTVEGVVDAIWYNQGQVCCAGSRLLIQENVAETFIKKLQRRMDNLRVGDSLDKCIDMGALVNEAQLQRVQYYVELARKEGAKIYQSPNQTLPKNGLFFPPTLIYNVHTTSQVVIDEIFGPVLTLMTFRSPKEAIELANNSAFGLSSSIWSETISKALDMAFQVRAGVVWVNCHNLFDAAAGFGGYKESGFGREAGKEGLFEYLKPKWQGPIKISLTDEEKNAPWGEAVPPCPTFPALPSSSPSSSSKELTERSKINRTAKLYINGAQARPDQDHSSVIFGPGENRCGEVGWGNRKDIRNAVEAAAAAAPGWGKRAAYNRSQILFYIAENLDARFEEFAERISQQTGRAIEEARKEVTLSIERLFYWAAFCDKFGGNVQETPLYGATICITEAVGVIGIGCPDEYPLLGFVSLFAPAIVRGNTVVIVPSQKAPLTATDLYQVFETSDLPNGVVNIVTGDRDSLIKILAQHMEVDSVWYFGSAIGSYHVEKLSGASNLKRTFVSYGIERNWEDTTQAAGHEFLHSAVQFKNIWIPVGV